MSNQKGEALQEARAELTMTMGPQMAAMMSGTVAQMMDLELQMVKQISMQEVTDEECNAMIKDLDADKDGIVSKQDFLINARKTLFDPNPPEEIAQAVEAIEAAADFQAANVRTPVRMLGDCADGLVDVPSTYGHDTHYSIAQPPAGIDSVGGTSSMLHSGGTCLYNGRRDVQQGLEVPMGTAMSSAAPLPTTADIHDTSPRVVAADSSHAQSQVTRVNASEASHRVVRIPSKDRGEGQRVVRALPEQLSQSRRYVQSPDRHCTLPEQLPECRRYARSPERQCAQSPDRRYAHSPDRRFAQAPEPHWATRVPAAIRPQSISSRESSNFAAMHPLRVSAQVPPALHPVQRGITTRLHPNYGAQATILAGGITGGIPVSTPPANYNAPGVTYARSVSRGPPAGVRPGSSCFQVPGAKVF